MRYIFVYHVKSLMEEIKMLLFGTSNNAIIRQGKKDVPDSSLEGKTSTSYKF